MGRKPKQTILYFNKEIPKHIVYYSILKSEIGDILITANSTDLLSVQFLREGHSYKTDPDHENAITKQAKQELKEYFAGQRKEFSEYNMQLLSFPGEVMRAIKTIPYGTTITYIELAKLVGTYPLIKMTADALEQNDYLIMIPSHRIIGSDKKLHRYQAGIKRKRYLLELEKKYMEQEEKKV